MRYQLSLLILIFLIKVLHADRSCGSDYSNLWLDVVLVIDDSSNTTVEKLRLVVSNIIELFGQGTRIGTNYDDPRSTRLAIVPYSSTAFVFADLDRFNSFQEFSRSIESVFWDTLDTKQSNLSLGLIKAEEALEAGRSNGTRNNYQQLIIVYTSSYQQNSWHVAQRLKEKNIHIAVVNMGSDDKEVEGKLRSIATDNMYFMYNTHLFDSLFHALMRTNCFCSNKRTNYTISKRIQGTCLTLSDVKLSWESAKNACQRDFPNGFLASDMDVSEHSSIEDLLHKADAGGIEYYIGLFLGDTWHWEQPAGPPLGILRGDNKDRWKSGYPVYPGTDTAVAVSFNDIDGARWINIDPKIEKYYICESNACDTDNYCA